MAIPFGFYQGNRSEYLAIPALSKLGFTIPVPRQVDHFGVDFIVHLTNMVDNMVVPTGKSFGIQIKSDKGPLTFNKQADINCLYGSSLPFFLGVVSRESLNLTIYNTIDRLKFFWGPNSMSPFTLTFNSTDVVSDQQIFVRRTADEGKPIVEINIGDPESASKRKMEIRTLQSTMKSWINLENENLSLKEQKIPIVFWPTDYSTNEPLTGNWERCSYAKFASPDSLANICKATGKALTSLSFYLEKLSEDASLEIATLMKSMREQTGYLEERCEELISKWHQEHSDK